MSLLKALSFPCPFHDFLMKKWILAIFAVYSHFEPYGSPHDPLSNKTVTQQSHQHTHTHSFITPRSQSPPTAAAEQSVEVIEATALLAATDLAPAKPCEGSPPVSLENSAQSQFKSFFGPIKTNGTERVIVFKRVQR